MKVQFSFLFFLKKIDLMMFIGVVILISSFDVSNAKIMHFGLLQIDKAAFDVELNIK